MKNLIKQKLVDYHANCGVDRYGQIGALDFYRIFGDDGKAIYEYLSKNKGVLQLCTYGGKYGTYTGISEILDTEIKYECRVAFNNNSDRQASMRRW
jgi:hypothetical protein